MPEPTKNELLAEIATLKSRVKELSKVRTFEESPTTSGVDPLSLLTPEALSGIKPMLRMIKDGTRFFPFLSYKDAQKMRHLGAFMEQIEKLAGE